MILVYIIIPVIIFAGELIIKNHMGKSIREGEQKPILGGHILLRKYHNKGAMLNLGEKRRGLVAALSVILALFVLVLFIMSMGTRGNHLLRAGLAFLLGGAFSNTYDRLKRKYVVDYFSFHVKSDKLRGIVFNISDFCIIIGAMIAACSAS